jgi:hypothetical protein
MAALFCLNMLLVELNSVQCGVGSGVRRIGDMDEMSKVYLCSWAFAVFFQQQASCEEASTASKSFFPLATPAGARP